MALKREDVIGKRRAVGVQPLDVPGWGPLFVRKLSAAERVRCEYMLRENDGKPLNYHARFAVLWVADADGNRVFTDADADTLGADPAHADAIVAVCEAGLTFNAMRQADQEEAKKNSEPTPTG